MKNYGKNMVTYNNGISGFPENKTSQNLKDTGLHGTYH